MVNGGVRLALQTASGKIVSGDLLDPLLVVERYRNRAVFKEGVQRWMPRFLTPLSTRVNFSTHFIHSPEADSLCQSCRTQREVRCNHDRSFRARCSKSLEAAEGHRTRDPWGRENLNMQRLILELLYSFS